MIVYIPAVFEDEDYEPSWTGNYTYPTVTIRGIFDSEEKATKAIEGWNYADSCQILTREFYEEDENGNEIISEKWLDDNGVMCFDIDYDDYYLSVYPWMHGSYMLNEIVDDRWSAVYDPDHHLGFDDF